MPEIVGLPANPPNNPLTQVWHVLMYIRWDYKSPLHFYTGAEEGGRLTQADCPVLLEEVVAPNRDKDWMVLEDNDNAYSTRGKADNKVKQAETCLQIQWEANCPESPDLNPTQSIWRLLKQRLKSRGPSPIQMSYDELSKRNGTKSLWRRLIRPLLQCLIGELL